MENTTNDTVEHTRGICWKTLSVRDWVSSPNKNVSAVRWANYNKYSSCKIPM